MKRADKRRNLSNKQTEHSARSGSKEEMQQQMKATRALESKETISKPSYEKGEPGILVSDSSLGAEPSEVYMELVVHDINDSNRSVEASQNPTPCDMAEKESKDEQPKISAHRRKEPNHGEGESASETVTDSPFSNGESQTVEDKKVDRVEGRTKSELELCVADDRTPEATMDVDILDDGLNNVGSNEETLNAEEETEHVEKEDLNPGIGEMEMRIEKLEEELREVAALEISLYSVVPDHGGSSHKVHTPARRLSRLYTHACKHFSPCKRATIAKNTVSGLVLIAKSCGNDVPRLTFWWSNIVVLREIVTQAFGNSCHSASLTKVLESNVGAKNVEGKSPSLKWKTSFDSRQPNMHSFMDFIDDWQETRTFTSALEKVESWIFSRIVESIWWQTLTPNMQSLAADTNINKSIGQLLGPSLGDQQQGIFSISIWKIAFRDAFKRLCPVRAGGHDCGCLSVLSRMVMEKCVARLDVAMFNAILRESAYEIPTDPVSDPIVDSKVLPIPAGDLSFGSGAQLKNAVGNWSRCLSDWFGMDADDALKEEHHAGENDDPRKAESKCFHLLNALSDLLMLPKDMLMDRSVRAEVCPSISLPLLKRILCNFTPDEFCPDAVPGTVLEAINAECIIERRLSGDNSSSFPYTASPVIYEPPSSTDVAEKVTDAGTNGGLARSGSMIQRKGYTSDEELDALDFPLTSIIEKVHSSPSVAENGNGEQKSHNGFNMRYGLLREVWLS